jgi:non-specific serine/threonine protein kinase
VGLGGRDRTAASAAERARVNVTKAIKAALRRIKEHDPSLSHLLASSIRTGAFCSFDPGPDASTVWRD